MKTIRTLHCFLCLIVIFAMPPLYAFDEKTDERETQTHIEETTNSITKDKEKNQTEGDSFMNNWNTTSNNQSDDYEYDNYDNESSIDDNNSNYYDYNDYDYNDYDNNDYDNNEGLIHANPKGR